MLLAAIVLAAILTEKNGTFADAPANAAVAVPSAYIPYGTYTDGSGSTECMRVVTNLVGGVASLIDGLWERVAIPYGWLPEDLAVGDCAELKYPLRESARDTKRFLAAAINYGGSDEYGSGLRYQIEQTLAEGYVYETWEPGPGGMYTYKTNAIHAGIAGSWPEGYINSEGLRFRDYEPDLIAWTSRKADDLFFGAKDPPISTEWSARLPFLVEDLDDWQNVFGVYSAYEYDPHFFPSNYEDLVAYNLDYARPHIRRWMIPDHLDDIWGDDVYGTSSGGTGWDLYEKLKTLPVATNAVMEEVLKVDPGFEYPKEETNSFWEVTGDLGTFHCKLESDGGPRDKYYRGDGSDTNFYCEVWLSSGSESAWIDVAVSQRGVGRVFYGWDYYHDEDGVVVWGEEYYPDPGPYAATRTRMFRADDFEHWRNMTTRLDWKRLGVIAQLERHMETTYRVREREDYLPLWEFFCRVHRNYDGILNLHVKIEDDGIAEAYVVGHKPSLSLQYANWTLSGETSETQTNRISSSYPTARTIVNLDGARVRTSSSNISGTFDIRDDEIFDGIADAIARHVAPWPAGAKKIRADLNLGRSGIAVATIFVWYGPEDVRSFSVGESPFSYFTVPDLETEEPFFLQRDDAKVARDVTTLANNATQEYKIMKRDIQRTLQKQSPRIPCCCT